MSEDFHDPFGVGEYLVEPRLNRISKGSEHIAVRPRAMDLLVYLAARGGAVVDSDEIIEKVWGGLFVTSGVIYNCVNELRHVFDDDKMRPAYIETIPKRGYRLIAPVRFIKEQNADSDAPEPVSKTADGGRMKALALTGALALALLIVAYQYLNLTRTPTLPVPERSIAVLPFVDLSPTGDQQYFADGIAEDLLNALAQVPQLKVTGRTSSFTFRGGNKDLRVIGEVLGVSHILEGSVRRDGTRVRVTAQLVKASDGFHVWSETYDREFTDIFAMQDEIAAKVVEQLKITLLGDAPTVQAADPEAYSLVLQARYLRRQFTPDAFEKTIALLEQALAIDPGYAAAWAGLALGYNIQTAQGLRPFDEGYRLAREAADKALEIDPAYVPAHSSLAEIAKSYDRDFVAAAKHFERALAIEPANGEAIFGASRLAADLGRTDQAIALAEHAIARDPVNPIGVDRLGLYYLYAGRLDQAIAFFRTALTLSPGLIGAQSRISTALLLKGEPQAALAAMQKETFEAQRLLGLVTAHHALGQAAASDAALAELIEKHERGWAYNIGYVLAFRGEADRAFEWLNKAVAYNDSGLAAIAIWPLFANIHNDPRWLPFLESIGKSPEQLAAIEFNVTLPK